MACRARAWKARSVPEEPVTLDELERLLLQLMGTSPEALDQQMRSHIKRETLVGGKRVTRQELPELPKDAATTGAPEPPPARAPAAGRHDCLATLAQSVGSRRHYPGCDHSKRSAQAATAPEPGAVPRPCLATNGQQAGSRSCHRRSFGINRSAEMVRPDSVARELSEVVPVPRGTRQAPPGRSVRPSDMRKSNSSWSRPGSSER